MDDKSHTPAGDDRGDREQRIQVVAELAARPLEERVGERMRRALQAGPGRGVRKVLRRLAHHDAAAVANPVLLQVALLDSVADQLRRPL